MPNCTAEQMPFGRVGRQVIEANFEGGALSSNGGLLLLRQVDQRIGLSKAVASALHDPRNQDMIVQRCVIWWPSGCTRCVAAMKT